MNEAEAKLAAKLCECIANAVRFKMICAMLDRERNVGELTSIGGQSQSATSQHLARLRAAGVVSVRKEAQSVYYTCRSEELIRLLHVIRELAPVI